MKDLTKGNVYKNFILFAIPLVLSGLLTQAFNVINGMLSGNFLGEAGLAATGSTSSFFQLYGSFYWGWGMGFSIYIAKLFGERNYSKLRNSIYISVIALVTLSVFSATLMLILKKPMLLRRILPSVRTAAARSNRRADYMLFFAQAESRRLTVCILA